MPFTFQRLQTCYAVLQYLLLSHNWFDLKTATKFILVKVPSSIIVFEFTLHFKTEYNLPGQSILLEI